MIPFEIEYIRPLTAADAVAAYTEAAETGKSARYLSGGTELVTMAREGKITFDVLIDLKRLPETTVLDQSTFGSAVRLSQLRDVVSGWVSGSVQVGLRAGTPVAISALALVGKAAGGVADRTTRNSITLGGNICGMLPYREALLPFLLLDGEATIMGKDGARRVRLAEVFSKRLKTDPGEFLMSLHLDPAATSMDGFYQRRTREPRVDYPLVTLCMARESAGYRMVVGGAFGPPVRSRAAEEALNAANLSSPEERSQCAWRAAATFGETFRSDLRGSADYRQALLAQSIEEGLDALGGRE